MLSFGLFLTLVAASHQLSIDEFVVPVSAEKGSSVELKCSLDESDGGFEFIKWWFTPSAAEEAKPSLIYQRIGNEREVPLHPNYRVEWVGPNDNIVLKNADPYNSGRYVCEASAFDEKRASGDLVVYSNGTGPQLNLSLVDDGPDSDEEQDLLVTCRADDVTPEPELGISANGRPLAGVLQAVTPVADRYSVAATVTVSRADLEDAEVRCELFYVNQNITHLPFVDVINYSSSGAEPTTEAQPLEVEQETTNSTDAAHQINRSPSRSVCWLLSITAVLVAVSQLIQSSNCM